MSSQSWNRFALSLGLIGISLLSQGCAKGSGVTLQSRGFNVAQMNFFEHPFLAIRDLLVPNAYAAGAFTGIKFCITQMKLEAEDGSSIKDEETDSDLFEAKLGWVDLGNGNTTVSWGDLPIPHGTKLKRIKVEIHKDQELCGTAYSAALTTASATRNLTKDIELKFAFSSAKELSEGDSVTVSLANLIAQFESAEAAGKLNDSQITSYLENYANGSDDRAD